jgi:hypothetical protein
MKPILFSTPMVQAIMEGRKTQTRRVVKPQPHSYGEEIIDSGIPWYKGKGQWHNRFVVSDNPTRYEIASTHDCPYGKVGDILWVRETWQTGALGWIYRASWNSKLPDGVKWKPSIFMPREACRLFLRIKSIRVERLQDISEDDAKSEGIQFHFEELFQEFRYRDYDKNLQKGYGNPSVDYPTWREAKSSFQSLWVSINGQDSWDANPWVWVVEFERV